MWGQAAIQTQKACACVPSDTYPLSELKNRAGYILQVSLEQLFSPGAYVLLGHDEQEKVDVTGPTMHVIS